MISVSRKPTYRCFKLSAPSTRQILADLQSAWTEFDVAFNKILFFFNEKKTEFRESSDALKTVSKHFISKIIKKKKKY